MPIRIKVPDSDAEYAQLFELRQLYFSEQASAHATTEKSSLRTSQSLVEASDAFPSTFHVVALEGQRMLACLRVSKLSSVGSLPDRHYDFTTHVSIAPNVEPYCFGLVSIAESARQNAPLKKYLFSNAIRWAQKRGATEIYASVAEPFSATAQNAGFEALGPECFDSVAQQTVLPSRLELGVQPLALDQASDFTSLDIGDPLERLIYARKEVIIRQWDRGYCAYLLTKGVADVVIEKDDRSEHSVATLGEGALFGELALVAEARRSATIRAKRECEVIMITPALFRDYIRKNPDNAERVIALLGQRQQSNLAGLTGSQSKEQSQKTKSQDSAHVQRPAGSVYQSLLRGQEHNTRTFSQAAREDWLSLHKEIAQEYRVTQPYFEFAQAKDKQSSLSIKNFINSEAPGLGPIDFIAGPLSSFSSEFVAAFTTAQLTAYVDRGAIGSLPRTAAHMRDLTAACLHGFNPNDYLIGFVSRNERGEISPLVGAKLIAGRTQKSLLEENGSKTSSLPTLSSLRVIDPDFEERARQISADQVVCLSRYFSVDMRSLGINERAVQQLAELLISMGGIVAASQLNQRAGYCLFDTHIDALVRKYQRDFGAVYTASGSQVLPTQLVTHPRELAGILRYHYGPRELGGYEGRIHVTLVDSKKYQQGAKEQLAEYCQRYDLKYPYTQAAE